jgi:hypothetical protein
MSRSQETTIVKYPRKDSTNRYDFRFTIIWDTVVLPHTPNLKVYVMDEADDMQSKKALQHDVDYKLKVSPSVGGTISLVNPTSLESRFGTFGYIIIEKTVPYSQPASYVAPTSTDIVSKLDLLVDQIQQLHGRIYALEGINGIYKLNQDIQPGQTPIFGPPHTVGTLLASNSADGTSCSGTQAQMYGDTLYVPGVMTDKLDSQNSMSTRQLTATTVILKNQNKEMGISSLSDISNIILKILKGTPGVRYKLAVSFTGNTAFFEITEDAEVSVKPPHAKNSIAVFADATGDLIMGTSCAIENGVISANEIDVGTVKADSIVATGDITGLNAAFEDVSVNNCAATGNLTGENCFVTGGITSETASIEKNAEVGGDCAVTGKVTANTANVSGNITSSGNLTAAGATLSGNLTAVSATLSGNITAAGFYGQSANVEIAQCSEARAYTYEMLTQAASVKHVAYPSTDAGELEWDLQGQGASAVGTEMVLTAVKLSGSNQWRVMLKAAATPFNSGSDKSEYQHISYDVKLYDGDQSKGNKED